MMEQVISEILQRMSNKDINDLKDILYLVLSKYEISEVKHELQTIDNRWEEKLNEFITRKVIEGRSKNTIELYNLHLKRALSYINKPVEEITESDLFSYITMYKNMRKVSNVYLDNIRLTFSSFFTWLNNKGYISKNPTSGLEPIKSGKKIKKIYSEIELEKIRMACSSYRDRAIIEFLYSTGVRVSELIRINISDIDFLQMEVLIKGKGNKERVVYITPIACLHIKKYLENRNDINEALFVSQKSPYNRLTSAGIENILKHIGKSAEVENVHPHRFRRTLATNILNKGMPIEEVKELLGHTKLDTTMIYCQISKENVKYSHKKYMSV